MTTGLEMMIHLSVADSWALHGDWQEPDEDDMTAHDADSEEDSWNVLEAFPEELAHNVTPAVLDGQVQERDVEKSGPCRSRRPATNPHGTVTSGKPGRQALPPSS